MVFYFQRKKSAGIPVTKAVHRLIAQGNAARDRKDWAEAVQPYRKAVQRAPKLAHIWVQLGHAEKESGQLGDAAAAYRHAADLRPDQADPLVHLGHVAKLEGDLPGAARYYLRAFKIEPDNPDALSELYHIVSRATGYTRDIVLELLRSTVTLEADGTLPFGGALVRAETALSQALAAADGPSAIEPLKTAAALIAQVRRSVAADGGHVVRGGPGSSGPVLVFDISDLVDFFSHSRVPSGIQRVQIETISSVLARGERAVHLCCLIEGRDDWVEVPAAQFVHLAALSRCEGTREDASWSRALGKLLLTLALAEPFGFARGSHLISLGSSWSRPNYFLHVRHAKREFGVRYIPFVHDLIPVMRPEYCVQSLVKDFVSWMVGMFAHADVVFANSEATKRDLFEVAAIHCQRLRPSDVTVIPLDADSRRPEATPLEPATLRRWQLEGQSFVLMVGTIEVRKGHLMAFDAWLELIGRHGVGKIPKLVCAGRNGWLNQEVYQRLDGHKHLASRVLILSGLSDDELALLYRSCLFTIYPSFYEGWGLPITESLCYGKPVITSDNTSLPEAGGAFAVIIETGSSTQLAEAVETMTFDTAYRNELAARIERGFRARTWRDVAQQIDAGIVQRVGGEDGHEAPYRAPPARLGVYYPVTRLSAPRIWPGIGSGELFRGGTGWLWPEAWGCWTRPKGGTMAMSLPAGHGALCVCLLLRGLAGQDCTWSVQAEGGTVLQGILHGDERRLVVFDHPAAMGEDMLQVEIRGGLSQLVQVRSGGAEREDRASVGVCGFYIHETADAAGRTALLEAIAFGELDQLDAYGERAAALAAD